MKSFTISARGFEQEGFHCNYKLLTVLYWKRWFMNSWRQYWIMYYLYYCTFYPHFAHFPVKSKQLYHFNTSFQPIYTNYLWNWGRYIGVSRRSVRWMGGWLVCLWNGVSETPPTVFETSIWNLLRMIRMT